VGYIEDIRKRLLLALYGKESLERYKFTKYVGLDPPCINVIRKAAGDLTTIGKGATMVTTNRQGVPLMLTKRYKYEVQGRGDFPWDMLRYDRVYPTTSPSPSMHAIASNSNIWREVRTVELMGNGCTPDRWASFLWSVVDAENAVKGVR